MAYNYNNYFNNCGVNCGDTDPCVNTGCKHCQDTTYTNCSNSYSDSCYDKSDYSKSYSCSECYVKDANNDGSTPNYSDKHYSDCSNYCSNSYSDHYNCTNNYDDCTNHSDYSKSGYRDYKDGTQHANHFDNTNYAPDMRYSIDGIDAYSTADWVKLGDAIGDLKKLRNAIADMPNRKLDAEGKDFTMYLSSNANSDDKFAAGQTPKAAQFNETRSNIKKLWEKIWGNEGSDWPAEVKRGDKMKKSDYQKLFNKVDSLAHHDQSNFYANHYDSKKNGQNNGQ